MSGWKIEEFCKKLKNKEIHTLKGLAAAVKNRGGERGRLSVEVAISVSVKVIISVVIFRRGRLAPSLKK